MSVSTNKILNTSSFVLVKKSKQQEGGASRLPFLLCEAHRRGPQAADVGRRPQIKVDLLHGWDKMGKDNKKGKSYVIKHQ